MIEPAVDQKATTPASADQPMGRPFLFRRRGGLWLFAMVLMFYLMSTSRERPWGDATPLWEVADSIVNRFSVQASTRWPATLPLGKDGKIYSVAPLLQAAVHVPGAAVQSVVHRWFPQQSPLILRFTCHLAPALLAVLTCLIFFDMCRRLGVRPAAAGLATVALAFATSLWVYSRYPYSEPLQVFCFTGFLAQVLKTRDAPSLRSGALLGLWAGLLANAKLVYVASIAGAVPYLVWELRGRWRPMLRTAAAAMATALPLGLAILLYNYVRWGSWFNSGYDTSSRVGFRENPFMGLWGMFLSPGKSIFLYSPPLLASLLALRLAWRRWPHVLLAAAATTLPTLLVCARLIFWAGDFAWGPRYLMFALPALLLPASLLLNHVLAGRGWRRLFACSGLAVLLLAGGGVQYLGNAFYWDHYIRIQRDAARSWLGQANGAGSGIPFSREYGCGACFEDMYPMTWLPPFQPIVGHYWLLHHVPFDHDWVRAENDAPWHRYTSLRLNIAETYRRARVDWWFTEFRRINPWASWTLLILFPAAGLIFLVLFVRELRRSSRESIDSRAGTDDSQVPLVSST